SSPPRKSRLKAGLYDGPGGRPARGLATAPRDARGRETTRKRAALALAALDAERAAVALQRVLDDGEPEARPARGPRAARIDAIAALGHPWDLIARDADAGIRDDQGRAVAVGAPRHVNPARRRCEAHRVVNQVVRDRVQLALLAEQRRI